MLSKGNSKEDEHCHSESVILMIPQGLLQGKCNFLNCFTGSFRKDDKWNNIRGNQSSYDWCTTKSLVCLFSKGFSCTRGVDTWSFSNEGYFGPFEVILNFYAQVWTRKRSKSSRYWYTRSNQACLVLPQRNHSRYGAYLENLVIASTFLRVKCVNGQTVNLIKTHLLDNIKW